MHGEAGGERQERERHAESQPIVGACSRLRGDSSSSRFKQLRSSELNKIDSQCWPRSRQ